MVTSLVDGGQAQRLVEGDCQKLEAIQSPDKTGRTLPFPGMAPARNG
jgi:hypothetical protein